MIEIYREPSSHLISVPWQGVILDRGVLKKAIKNSKGEYVFSEFGAGVQPLVVIGRFPELVNFFIIIEMLLFLMKLNHCQIYLLECQSLLKSEDMMEHIHYMKLLTRLRKVF